MTRSEMADGLRWAGGYRAVSWRADGLQGADGCCAGARGWHAARWRMLCRGSPGAAQNDGRWLAGGAPDVVPCVADGLWRVGRWRVEGRRMLRRKQADGAWRAGELPAEGAQGLYLARKSYSPFRQKGYSSGETGLLSIIPSYLKKSVDEDRANEDTNFCCETRRYLSWIEGLTTNQYVGGSNPSRRTIETAGHRGFYLGGFFVFTGSFRPVGAIWVLSAAHRTLRSLSIAAALGL